MVTRAENMTNPELNKKGKGWRIFFGSLCSVVLFIAVLLFFSASWYIRNYGDTGFDSVLFTLLSKQEGVNGGLVSSYCLEGLLPTVICSAFLIFFLFIFKSKKRWFSKIKFWFKAVICLVISLVLLYNAGTKVSIFGYLEKMMNTSTIYEDYFVEPTAENIKFPEKKRNLIYIFLESMEVTYMSKEEGGALPKNIIPELTRLAEENVNFSHNDSVGGFVTPNGTGWTVAGMVSQSSGVPLKGSSGALANNEYGKESFMPGVTSLSNVLHDNGYKQALVVGSQATYANRNVYYGEHETDYIYDLLTAKEEGFIDEDYYVWWGMEDKYLFDYAKDKILNLAAGDEPFALTLLTVDTHFPDGYICDLCENRYSEQYNNVLACASHQVESFVNWIKQQSFYKDTAIVICGDHLSMDFQYIERNVPNGYSRKVYNCFINAAVPAENSKNRILTSLDMFPSTLAAMGCEIKGDRLGLGTNLFSDRQTLAEELGYEEFDRQMLYSSDYYIRKFLIK